MEYRFEIPDTKQRELKLEYASDSITSYLISNDYTVKVMNKESSTSLIIIHPRAPHSDVTLSSQTQYAATPIAQNDLLPPVSQ